MKLGGNWGTPFADRKQPEIGRAWPLRGTKPFLVHIHVRLGVRRRFSPDLETGQLCVCVTTVWGIRIHRLCCCCHGVIAGSLGAVVSLQPKRRRMEQESQNFRGCAHPSTPFFPRTVLRKFRIYCPSVRYPALHTISG